MTTENLNKKYDFDKEMEPLVELPTKRIPFFEAVAAIPNLENILSFLGATGCSSRPERYIKTFIEALESGYYPPIEVLEWLSTAFKKIIASEGDRKLDDLLELNNGPGKDRIFKSEKFKHEMAHDIEFLHRCGLSIEKACNAVSEKAAAGGYSKKYPSETAPSNRALRNYLSDTSWLDPRQSHKKFDLEHDWEIEITETYTDTDFTFSTEASFDSDASARAFMETIHDSVTSRKAVRGKKHSDILKELLETFPEATTQWIRSEIKF